MPDIQTTANIADIVGAAAAVVAILLTLAANRVAKMKKASSVVPSIVQGVGIGTLVGIALSSAQKGRPNGPATDAAQPLPTHSVAEASLPQTKPSVVEISGDVYVDGERVSNGEIARFLGSFDADSAAFANAGDAVGDDPDADHLSDFVFGG